MPRHELGIIENINIEELIRKFKNNKLNIRARIIIYRLFHELNLVRMIVFRLMILFHLVSFFS